MLMSYRYILGRFFKNSLFLASRLRRSNIFIYLFYLPQKAFTFHFDFSIEFFLGRKGRKGRRVEKVEKVDFLYNI